MTPSPEINAMRSAVEQVDPRTTGPLPSDFARCVPRSNASVSGPELLITELVRLPHEAGVESVAADDFGDRRSTCGTRLNVSRHTAVIGRMSALTAPLGWLLDDLYSLEKGIETGRIHRSRTVDADYGDSEHPDHGEHDDEEASKHASSDSRRSRATAISIGIRHTLSLARSRDAVGDIATINQGST